MKNWKRTAATLLLLAIPAFMAPAQTSTAAPDARERPQWLRDLRRWEIVTFGAIPFGMFTATFAMDMYRWSQANGMDFSEAGRRYAPWPLKSAGAIAMNGKEVEQTIMIAASLSVAVGIADFIIVQVKRDRARRRAEALPVGTAIITHSPWGDEDPSDEDDGDAHEDEQLSPDESSPELLQR